MRRTPWPSGASEQPPSSETAIRKAQASARMQRRRASVPKARSRAGTPRSHPVRTRVADAGAVAVKSGDNGALQLLDRASLPTFSAVPLVLDHVRHEPEVRSDRDKHIAVAFTEVQTMRLRAFW